MLQNYRKLVARRCNAGGAITAGLGTGSDALHEARGRDRANVRIGSGTAFFYRGDGVLVTAGVVLDLMDAGS